MKASRLVSFIIPFVFTAFSTYPLDDSVAEWLSDNVSDPAYSVQLEYLLSTVEDSDELILIVDQYIPFIDDLEVRAYLFYQAAFLFELWGNFQMAIDTYRTAYAVNPLPNYAFREALLLYETGQYTGSRRVLSQIGKHASKPAGYELLLLRLDYKELPTDTVMASAKTLADDKDASAVDIYYYYSLLTRSGREQEAGVYREKLDTKYPTSPEAAIARHLSGSATGQVREFPSLSRLLPVGDELVLLETVPEDQVDDSLQSTSTLLSNKNKEDTGKQVSENSDADRPLLGLQVASFVNKNNAESLLETLLKKGIPAKPYIMEIDTDSGHYYRVVIAYDPNTFSDSNTFFTTLLGYNIEGILLYDN